MSKLDGQQVLKQSFDDDQKALKTTVLSSLVPESYDTIELGYTGDDVTSVTYKSDGSTVATLTLTYTGGNLTKIARS